MDLTTNGDDLFPSLSSFKSITHLHPMLLPFLVENFIIQLFAQELNEATSCDMLLMVDYKASGRKWHTILISPARRNRVPFRITSKASSAYNRKCRGPRTPRSTPLDTDLGSGY